MNRLDKDSVLNFLTPTKLVTTTAKPKFQNNPLLHESSRRSNSNNPPLDLNYSGNHFREEHSDSRNSQLPPYSFTAQFDKLR